MSIEQAVGLGLAGLVMLIGLIGTMVPGIPGAPLILAAAVGHKLYFQDASLSWLALAMMLLLTVLSLFLDFLASVLGAKKMGATWRGMLGAIMGAMVGLFFSLPGIILGPIIGAFLFELAAGREWKESARAGAGAMVGLLLGAVAKVVCCVMMIAVFGFSAFLNAGKMDSGDEHPAALSLTGTALYDGAPQRSKQISHPRRPVESRP
jgi:uncharacterized protein